MGVSEVGETTLRALSYMRSNLHFTRIHSSLQIFAVTIKTVYVVYTEQRYTHTRLRTAQGGPSGYQQNQSCKVRAERKEDRHPIHCCVQQAR